MTTPHSKIFSLLLFALGVAGCAGPEPELARRAKDDLLGLSKEQLFACAGEPDEQVNKGDLENIYFVLERGLTGDYQYCQAKFVLEKGKVIELSYKLRNDDFKQRMDLCREIVQKCMQDK